MRTVYFIRPIGAEGPVKIGVSVTPWLRLEEMMRWSPLPLEIVATIKGGHDVEVQFHAKFKRLHSHKEWFRADPELSTTIAAIQAGVFDIASLPPGEYVTHARNGKAKSLEARRRIGVSARYSGAKRRGFTPPPELELRMRHLHSASQAEREAASIEADAWVATTQKAA